MDVKKGFELRGMPASAIHVYAFHSNHLSSFKLGQGISLPITFSTFTLLTSSAQSKLPALLFQATQPLASRHDLIGRSKSLEHRTFFEHNTLSHYVN